MAKDQIFHLKVFNFQLVTLWLFKIAVENRLFIDGLPINSMVDISMAIHISHNQMVNLHFPMVFLWFSYGFPMVNDIISLGIDIAIVPGFPLDHEPLLRAEGQQSSTKVTSAESEES